MSLEAVELPSPPKLDRIASKWSVRLKRDADTKTCIHTIIMSEGRYGLASSNR